MALRPTPNGRPDVVAPPSLLRLLTLLPSSSLLSTGLLLRDTSCELNTTTLLPPTPTVTISLPYSSPSKLLLTSISCIRSSIYGLQWPSLVLSHAYVATVLLPYNLNQTTSAKYQYHDFTNLSWCKVLTTLRTLCDSYSSSLLDASPHERPIEEHQTCGQSDNRSCNYFDTTSGQEESVLSNSLYHNQAFKNTQKLLRVIERRRKCNANCNNPFCALPDLTEDKWNCGEFKIQSCEVLKSAASLNGHCNSIELVRQYSDTHGEYSCS